MSENPDVRAVAEKLVTNLNEVLGGQLVCKDYSDSFEEFWAAPSGGCNDPSNDNGSKSETRAQTGGVPTISEMLADTSRQKALVIVWSQMPDPKPASDASLLQHLTPLDWALVTSQRLLAAGNPPRFSIHIVDLTCLAWEDCFAIRMRHQLLFEMPWVRLYAPLVPEEVSNVRRLRAGYRPLIAETGGLLKFSNLPDGQPVSDLADMPTIDKFQGVAKIIRALEQLGATWRGTIVRSDDHHDINNIIGAYVLGEMLFDSASGKQVAGLLPIQRALLRRFFWSSDSNERQSIDYPVPEVPTDSPIRILAVDDQLGNGWDRVLLKLVGANSTDVAETCLSTSAFQKIGTRGNRTLNVFGTLSAEPLIERLKQANFKKRDYLFDYLRTDSGDKIPEVIVLDLRLASTSDANAQKQQLEHILSLVEIAKGITDCKTLAWQGISKDEFAAIETWCGPLKASAGSTEAEVNALTLLPRLLALATPLTPIILFSSTGRAEIKAKLQPYRNVLVEFEKPRCFGEPETILARLNVFLDQFALSMKFGEVRRALIWLTNVSATVRRGNHPAQLKKEISDNIGRVEIFIDESGRPAEQERSVVGAFCLYHKDEGQAEDLNNSLINAAITAQVAYNRGEESALAPVWVTFKGSEQVERLNKYSEQGARLKKYHEEIEELKKYCEDDDGLNRYNEAVERREKYLITRLTMQKQVNTHLYPHICKHTRINGLRSYVVKQGQVRGSNGSKLMDDAMHVDKHWHRMAILHIESLVFNIFPWIFPVTRKALHVAIYFDKRSVPVINENIGQRIESIWGLRFNPIDNLINVIDNNSIHAMIRDTYLRWEGSVVAQKVNLSFKAGRATSLSTINLTHQKIPKLPRLIHWLADWVASVERNKNEKKSDELFSKAMPNALRLLYNDDSEKMLEATWHIAHLRYAEALLSFMKTTLFYVCGTASRDQMVPFCAATIVVGMAQAHGHDLHQVAAKSRDIAVPQGVAKFIKIEMGKPVDETIGGTSSELSTKRQSGSALTYWHIRCDHPFAIFRVKAIVKCKTGKQWYLVENQEGQMVVVGLVNYQTEPATMVRRFMKARSIGFKTVDLPDNRELGIVAGPYTISEFDTWVGVTETDAVRPESAPILRDVAKNSPHLGTPEPVTITAKKIVILPNSNPGWAIEAIDGRFFLLYKTLKSQKIRENDELKVVLTGGSRQFLGKICQLVNFAD